MTTKPNALIQAACISLFLTLLPGTAASQEPKESAAEQQPAKAAGEPVPAAERPAPDAGKSSPYIIKPGDTLWDISNAFFKDPFLWPFIWKANPSITNPDLIYAGNTLDIPSLAPIERAMEAPAEQATVTEETKAPEPETKPAEGMAAAQPKPPVHAPEETTAGGEKFMLPEEEAQPVTDKYSFLSAGFVNDVESTGTIIGPAVAGKTILGYDDVVYVRLSSGNNVNIGDKFLIYTPLQNVTHPRTRKPFGRLIRGLGILQITAKDPTADVLTARITLSFDSIEEGSLLTPYQEPTLVYQSPEKKAKDISGYILEVTDHRSINGQMDVVYLDKGSADGVDPGDKFIVYSEPQKRGYPREMIGEVQVFLVKERSSTAVVRKSVDVLSKGLEVDFKR